MPSELLYITIHLAQVYRYKITKFIYSSSAVLHVQFGEMFHKMAQYIFKSIFRLQLQELESSNKTLEEEKENVKTRLMRTKSSSDSKYVVLVQ